ncbi:MAG: hypothetical protein ACI9D1_002743, partial [Cryomorphaceae bacterium]
MQKAKSLIFLLLFISSTTFAQNDMIITWDQLADVRFEETYDEGTGAFYDKPVFGPMIQS